MSGLRDWPPMRCISSRRTIVAGALAPGDGEKKKSIGGRAREVATRSVIGLYKWNRDRKKKKANHGNRPTS